MLQWKQQLGMAPPKVRLEVPQMRPQIILTIMHRLPPRSLEITRPTLPM